MIAEGTAITLGLALVGGIYGYGRLSRSVESNKDAITDDKKDSDDQFKNVWKVVGDLREWTIQHARDSADRRLEIEKDIGHLRERIGNLDTKLDAIITYLKEISLKISKFEDERRARNDR